MAKGAKVAILLTQVHEWQRKTSTQRVSVPVSRIAKVSEQDNARRQLLVPGDPTQALVQLRAPDDGMSVVETVEQIVALMNGEVPRA